MTSLPTLLAQAQRSETSFTTVIPSNWLQGRTAYGGLSTALALAAAKQIEPDLPPLQQGDTVWLAAGPRRRYALRGGGELLAIRLDQRDVPA
mgnify:CR=1 FL=1